MANEDPLIKSLGVSPEQLVGYIYAGLYATLCAAIIDYEGVKRLVESLGGFLSTLVVLGLGVGIYTLYRRVLGEFLLYPMHHLVHYLLDLILKRSGQRHTSCTALLADIGVGFGERREAYEAIRELALSKEGGRKLELAHGEIHVLYLTAVLSVIVILFIQITASHRTLLSWCLIAVVSYVGALASDLEQHSAETRMLRTLGEDAIRTFLMKRGFLK